MSFWETVAASFVGCAVSLTVYTVFIAGYELLARKRAYDARIKAETNRATSYRAREMERLAANDEGRARR